MRLHSHFYFAFLLVVSLSVLAPVRAVSSSTSTSGLIHRSYTWEYNGSQWEWSVDIPRTLYDKYHAVAEYNRLGGRFNGYFVTTDDPVMVSVAEAFDQTAKRAGYGGYDRLGLLLSWVQSMPYTIDSQTSPYEEYPRFPVETLVDNGGDCEDTVYLFMTVLQIWGVGTIFVNPPGHLAAGVLGDGLSGYYYRFNGADYYYAETTGDGFKIGEMPDQWKGTQVSLYPMSVRGFNPSWQELNRSGAETSSSGDTGLASGRTSITDVHRVGMAGLQLLPYLLLLAPLLASVVAVLVEESKRRPLTRLRVVGSPDFLLNRTSRDLIETSQRSQTRIRIFQIQ